jgi:hypothetical protein
MFEQSQEERNELIAKEIEFASGYVPRNPEVLTRMREAVFRPLPPTATHAELAYAEGQRALVSMIIRQYQKAMTGSADTPWQTITTPPQAEPQTPAPRRKRTTSSTRSRQPSKPLTGSPRLPK